MTKPHKFTVEHLADNRVLLHANGFTLEAISDEDGIVATLFKGNEVQTELAFDWDEQHINA